MRRKTFEVLFEPGAHFLIITGMSGAGKTQVVRTLEDLNFFCIDNLPATLIPKFAELCRQTSEEKVALVGSKASWSAALRRSCLVAKLTLA